MVLHAPAARGGAGASPYALVDHLEEDAPSMRHLTPEQKTLLNSCIMTARAEKNAGDLITDLVSDTPFKGTFWVNREECTYRDWGYAALRASREGLITEDIAVDVIALAGFVEEFGYQPEEFTEFDSGAGVSFTRRPTAGIPLHKPAFKALLPGDEKYKEGLSYIFQAFGEIHTKEINEKIAELALHEKAIFAVYLPSSGALSPMHQTIIKTLRIRHCPRLHLSPLKLPSLEEGSPDIRFFLHPTFALIKIALDILSTTTGLRQARLLPVFGSITLEEKSAYKASFTRIVHLFLPDLSPPESAYALPIRQGTLLLRDEYLLITDRCIRPLHTYGLNRLYAILQAAPAEMRAHPDFLAVHEKLVDAERLSIHPRTDLKCSFFSLFDDSAFETEQGRAILQQIYRDMAEQQEFWDAVLTAEDRAHKRGEESGLLRGTFPLKKLSISDLAYVLHIPPETLEEVSSIIEAGESLACLISFVAKLELHINSLAKRLFLFTETGDLSFFAREKKPSAHTLAFLLSLSSESLTALKYCLSSFPSTVDMVADLFHHFFNIDERFNHYLKAVTTLETPLRSGLIPYNHGLLLKGHDKLISFLASHLDQVVFPLPMNLEEYVFCKNDYAQIFLYINEGRCHVISTMNPRRRALLQLFLNDLLEKNEICLQFKNPLSRTSENRGRLAFICEAISNASEETFAQMERQQASIRLDLFNSLAKAC